MAPAIALMTPAALGLSADSVHQPVHTGGENGPMTVTERGGQNPPQRRRKLIDLSDGTGRTGQAK